MPKNTMSERTAKAPFKLGEEYISAGRVVPLTQAQIRDLSAKGCVALTDDEDADVPKLDLPPLQAAPGLIEGRDIESRMADARRMASDELVTLRKNVDDARAKADTDLTEQAKRVEDARTAADASIQAEADRVVKAKADADEAVKAEEKRAADAKAATDAALKAPKQSA